MIGVRLTVMSTVLTSIIVALAAVTVSLAGGVQEMDAYHRAVLCVLVLWALLSLVTVRGNTAREWIARRHRSHNPLRSALLVDAKGRGMVWDGYHASMFIEVTPDQWNISRIRLNGEATVGRIPIPDLRRELRQFDITVDRIRIVEYGYKIIRPDKASSSMLGAMGTVGHLLGGRVIIEVGVALSNNLNAVHSRQKDRDTVADGITRVVSIATDRVARTLHTHNISAKVLSPTALAAVHRDVFASVEGAIQHPKWTHTGFPGDATHGTTVSFSPAPTAWNARSQLQWDEVLSHRQYNCLELRPDRTTRDHVDYATTYLTDDPSLLQLLPSQGLVRENGRHMARVSNVLPLAKDAFRTHTGRLLSVGEEVGVDIPIHPLGVFAGTTKSREKVFLAITRGDTPLWVCGDEEYARRLVFRLSTQRHRIGVSVPDKTWDRLISLRRSERLKRVDDPSRAAYNNDVLVCTPEQEMTMELSKDGPAVIVVSPERPRVTKDAVIHRDGDNLVLQVGKDTETLVVDNPPTERPWVNIDRR
ncbi:MAG: hypothetical protein E6R04_04550 [Spirochaetes bacterium]|nr:MAG: hypothetical protein E6R04_04550 [Spirochaetota bacterium]